MADDKFGERVVIYTFGIAYASVCAPIGMSREVVERQTNNIHPTGISSRWCVADDPKFRTGQPNPCPCEHNPNRQHYLMCC